MNSRLVEIIGKELKLVRVDKDLSLKEAEAILGIKAQTLSLYENSNANMSLDKLDELLTLYKVNKNIFFTKVCERYSQNNERED